MTRWGPFLIGRGLFCFMALGATCADPSNPGPSGDPDGELPDDEIAVTFSQVGEGSVSLDPPGETYPAGQIVRVTATPASGWRFDRWEGGLTGTANPAQLTVNAESRITAVFARDGTDDGNPDDNDDDDDVVNPSLGIAALGLGSVASDPPGPAFTVGQTVRLTAAPREGWRFDRWDGDLSGAENPADLLMDGDKQVTAIFLPGYPLTTSVVGAGTIERNPPGDGFNTGQTVRLTARAAPGWWFGHWEGDLAGASNPSDLLIDGSRNVTAVFVEGLRINTTIVGEGAIERDPVSDVYVPGQVVLVTAVPAAGWGFLRWSGDLGGTGNPKVLTMDGHKNITANFVNVFSLTVAVVGEGGVLRDPEGEDFLIGQTVHLAATAAPGWRFHHWEGALSGDAPDTDLVMDSFKQVTAVFVKTHALEAGVAGGGSISRDPDKAVYDAGETVRLTAVSAPDWPFHHWQGELDGAADPTSAAIDLIMDSDKQVTAVFGHTLQIAAEGQGSVTRDPQAVSHATGENVLITAVPAAGWNFSHWSGDQGGTGNPKIINMNADKIITAHFVPD